MCAYLIMLHTFGSSPSLLGSHFDSLALLVLFVCLSLFSSLVWTNIFVRILFWVSLHVSTFPLPWSETAGETGRGKRESEREQINCIISAYKLNPRHKCSSSGGAFCRAEGIRQIKDKRIRDRHKEIGVDEVKRDGGSAAVQRSHEWETSVGGLHEKERVMESESAGREVDRCPVQVQWSAVFNLTWWTSYWKHHPPSSSFTTPTPFLTDRKPCDEAVFKVI